ncbi:MAG: NFACT family protein, partial [Sarcina sp.]
MARHSNISLVRKRDNKVMESIKHITANKNSYRVLYPGVTYVLPPISTKLNPFKFSMEELSNLFNKFKDNINDGIFSSLITGVSKNLSKYLFHNFNLKYNEKFTLHNLYNFINSTFKNILNNQENIIFSKEGKILDFYFIDIDFNKEYKKVFFNTHSQLLDIFYRDKDKQDRLHGRSLDIQRLLNTNIERCNKKIKVLENTLKECDSKEDYQLKGELLTSYIYGFKKGDKEVLVLNYYKENEEYLSIKIDENKTPSENVQYYFKKYNKLKTAEEAAINQLEINEAELNYLNSVLTNLQACDNYDDIDEIKKELIETGYIKFRKTKGKVKN